MNEKSQEEILKLQQMLSMLHFYEITYQNPETLGKITAQVFQLLLLHGCSNFEKFIEKTIKINQKQENFKLGLLYSEIKQNFSASNLVKVYMQNFAFQQFAKDLFSKAIPDYYSPDAFLLTDYKHFSEYCEECFGEDFSLIEFDCEQVNLKQIREELEEDCLQFKKYLLSCSNKENGNSTEEISNDFAEPLQRQSSSKAENILETNEEAAAEESDSSEQEDRLPHLLDFWQSSVANAENIEYSATTSEAEAARAELSQEKSVIITESGEPAESHNFALLSPAVADAETAQLSEERAAESGIMEQRGADLRSPEDSAKAADNQAARGRPAAPGSGPAGAGAVLQQDADCLGGSAPDAVSSQELPGEAPARGWGNERDAPDGEEGGAQQNRAGGSERAQREKAAASVGEGSVLRRQPFEPLGDAGTLPGERARAESPGCDRGSQGPEQSPPDAGRCAEAHGETPARGPNEADGAPARQEDERLSASDLDWKISGKTSDAQLGLEVAGQQAEQSMPCGQESANDLSTRTSDAQQCVLQPGSADSASWQGSDAASREAGAIERLAPGAGNGAESEPRERQEAKQSVNEERAQNDADGIASTNTGADQAQIAVADTLTDMPPKSVEQVALHERDEASEQISLNEAGQCESERVQNDDSDFIAENSERFIVEEARSEDPRLENESKGDSSGKEISRPDANQTHKNRKPLLIDVINLAYTYEAKFGINEQLITLSFTILVRILNGSTNLKQFLEESCRKNSKNKNFKLNLFCDKQLLKLTLKLDIAIYIVKSYLNNYMIQLLFDDIYSELVVVYFPKDSILLKSPASVKQFCNVLVNIDFNKYKLEYEREIVHEIQEEVENNTGHENEGAKSRSEEFEEMADLQLEMDNNELMGEIEFINEQTDSEISDSAGTTESEEQSRSCISTIDSQKFENINMPSDGISVSAALPLEFNVIHEAVGPVDLQESSSTSDSEEITITEEVKENQSAASQSHVIQALSYETYYKFNNTELFAECITYQSSYFEFDESSNIVQIEKDSNGQKYKTQRVEPQLVPDFHIITQGPLQFGRSLSFQPASVLFEFPDTSSEFCCKCHLGCQNGFYCYECDRSFCENEHSELLALPKYAILGSFIEKTVCENCYQKVVSSEEKYLILDSELPPQVTFSQQYRETRALRLILIYLAYLTHNDQTYLDRAEINAGPQPTGTINITLDIADFSWSIQDIAHIYTDKPADTIRSRIELFKRLLSGIPCGCGRELPCYDVGICQQCNKLQCSECLLRCCK